MILAKSTPGPRNRMTPSAMPRCGQRPAAEEQRGGDGGEGERGPELTDEEEQEAEPRVLDHVAGDELALRHRHVERRLRELGLRRDQEEAEPDELREDEREADAAPPEDRPGALRQHDPLQAHRAGLDDHTHHREQERQLVRDELTGARAHHNENLFALAQPAISTPITERLDTASA